MLIHLYAVHAWGQDTKADAETPRVNGFANGHANGHATGHSNGYARVDRRVRDAEEFELDGLDSEDDDDGLENKERRPLVAQR